MVPTRGVQSPSIKCSWDMSFVPTNMPHEVQEVSFVSQASVGQGQLSSEKLLTAILE